MADHTHGDKHEAHRLLVKRLRQHGDDVNRITSGLDEDTMSAHTVEGKWSLKEFVCHLQRAQNVFRGFGKSKYRKHQFAFGSLLSCAHDGCRMTAELPSAHVCPNVPYEPS